MYRLTSWRRSAPIWKSVHLSRDLLTELTTPHIASPDVPVDGPFGGS